MKKQWKLRFIVIGVTLGMGLSGLAGRPQRVAAAGMAPSMVPDDTAAVYIATTLLIAPQGISTSPGRP